MDRCILVKSLKTLKHLGDKMMIQNLNSRFKCLLVATSNLCIFKIDLNNPIKQIPASTKSHDLDGLLFHSITNSVVQSTNMGLQFYLKVFFLLSGLSYIIRKTECLNWQTPKLCFCFFMVICHCVSKKLKCNFQNSLQPILSSVEGPKTFFFHFTVWYKMGIHI